MTQETLEKAKKNRKERAEKLEQYNDVSRRHDNLSKDRRIWLDVCGNCNQRIFPTNSEYKNLLRTIRDRLDAEISALDKEFESL